MKRLRLYDRLPGDLFCQVDVQRAGASVCQAEGTAQAKTLRQEGVEHGFNNTKHGWAL